MRRISSIAPPTADLVGPGKLKVVNGRLAFSVPNAAPLHLDPDALRQVSCFGDVSISASALELLLAHDVEVALLTPQGHRCRGRLTGNHDSSTALRMVQHACYRDERLQLELARGAVLAKIASQREAVRHFQRHGTGGVPSVMQRLDAAARRAEQADALDVLRGSEGTAAAAWFELLGRLVKPPWSFRTRSHRPPRDPVNALLSLGYTWLLNRTVAKLQARGFEVNLGFLHEYHAGRPSLGCDVMEPFRVPGVDRWVVQFCNRHQLQPDDFPAQPDGGFHLPPEAFGLTVASWQNHWYDAQLESQLDDYISGFERQVRQAAQLPR
jgi:CRISPR-associated protein Cas1